MYKLRVSYNRINIIQNIYIILGIINNKYLTIKVSNLELKLILEPVAKRLDLTAQKLDKFAADVELPHLNELLKYVFSSEGKLTRPALTFLASDFNECEEEKIITMASAVEMLHIASLVHDDTVDESETRRGKTTVNDEFGDYTAVLLGDYIFAASATYVCETKDIYVIKRFSQTIMDLSYGQLMETSNVDELIKIENYMKRIYLKTASLFTISGESGAVLSGASDSKVNAIREYSHNIGMAFQIIDDLLDLGGQEKTLGKPVGNDLVNGIITLPIIYASEDPNYKERLLQFLKDPTDETLHKRLIEDTNKSNALERTYQYANKLIVKAKNSLTNLENNNSKNSLNYLAEFIIKRIS
jgi:heptaprenyl diphosphate synthase